MSPRGRRGVFNPENLADLDDVLPPAPRRTPGDEDRDEDLEPQVASGSDRDEPVRARQQGQRPLAAAPDDRSRRSERVAAARRQPAAQGGRIAAAIRLPADLYQQINVELLAGLERPSYGQLVVWACEDWPAQVVEAVEAALPDPKARTPRGRKLAQDRVPVQLQLTWDERAHLDEVAGDVAARHGVRVTRTDVATAALRVALRRPDPSVGW